MNMLTFFLITVITTSVMGTFGPYSSAGPHPVKPRLQSSKSYNPTNSWYENLLLGKGESAIQTYPYQVKAKEDGFCISYSGKSINQEKFILEGYLDNLILSVSEGLQPALIDKSTVDSSFYDLSVKINYGYSFNVVLVRGSPSVIANYRQATPVIKTIHAIMNQPSGKTSSLKLQFNNGQTWLVQSESPITWSTAGSEVKGATAYTGWIKYSIVTSDAVQNALNTYASSAPITNGHVTYSIDRSKEVVIVSLEYDQAGLFYMLPHVYVTGQTGASEVSGATVSGIKGVYKLATGKGYTYQVPIHKNSNPAKAVDSQTKRDNLKSALVNDLSTLKFDVKDPYFGGKELARAANLIEIADLLGEIDIKNRVKDLLVKELDTFWFGVATKSPALVYEPTWGGIVSRKSVGSAQADFGQYYYNDHHFHYGYHINAAATLAKHYPEYYASRREYYRIIVADYAGSCEYVGLPCEARAKDPFLGHSYAAGIFEFADSRNQESTSESINGYFAVRELGKNTNDQAMEDLGDILLSTEIMSSQIYWHIKDTSIYAPPFAKNGVIGILWETKVDYSTFFGANPEYIYGIQMLPYNMITEAYLDSNWLAKTKNVWGAVVDSAVESWKCFLLLADALINPNQTGLSEKIHNLKTYDNGNSKTNTLFFYYMIGGQPSESTGTTVSPITGQTTKPASFTTIPVTNPVTSPCSGADCDAGVVTPLCGSGLKGCFRTDGRLQGCYDSTVAACFAGGNICGKPFVACVDMNNLQVGAACYNTSQYQCVNGDLKPISG